MTIEEQRARLLEDGYLVLPNALTPTELAPLRAAARAAEARWRADLSLPGAFWQCQEGPAMIDPTTDPAVSAEPMAP